jgi:hypothetical protein
MKGFIEASLQHDIGKANVEEMGVSYEGEIPVIGGRPFDERYKFLDKKGDFTQEDRRRINDHIDVGIILSGMEEPAKSIAACHHLWQKNPVSPALLRVCKRTNETNYLSKLLAIADFYDAASERANTRNSEFPRKLEPEEVKEVLLQEYENLLVVYKGNKLPKVKTNGRELINRFYNEGIFEKINFY